VIYILLFFPFIVHAQTREMLFVIMNSDMEAIHGSTFKLNGSVISYSEERQGYLAKIPDAVQHVNIQIKKEGYQTLKEKVFLEKHWDNLNIYLSRKGEGHYYNSAGIKVPCRTNPRLLFVKLSEYDTVNKKIIYPNEALDKLKSSLDGQLVPLMFPEFIKTADVVELTQTAPSLQYVCLIKKPDSSAFEKGFSPHLKKIRNNSFVSVAGPVIYHGKNTNFLFTYSNKFYVTLKQYYDQKALEDLLSKKKIKHVGILKMPGQEFMITLDTSIKEAAMKVQDLLHGQSIIERVSSNVFQYSIHD
jgi:hypothetical protein